MIKSIVLVKLIKGLANYIQDLCKFYNVEHCVFTLPSVCSQLFINTVCRIKCFSQQMF